MPIQPPAGTRLVLMSEDIAGQIGTRTEDGDRLSFQFSDPDQNGWSELIVTRTREPEFDAETSEEVLFLTSNYRLFEAYLSWYNHYTPGVSSNRAEAISRTRELLRYLKIPTSQEIRNYRAEELP